MRRRRWKTQVRPDLGGVGNAEMGAGRSSPGASREEEPAGQKPEWRRCRVERGLGEPGAGLMPPLPRARAPGRGRNSSNSEGEYPSPLVRCGGIPS